MDNESLLYVDIALQQGALDPLDMEIAFSLTQPWTCLFGASGSGKSTILRAIAGFIRPMRGRIALGAKPIVLADTAAGIHLPPHRRGVRVATQQPWLFPGTVASNLRRATHWKDQEAWLGDLLPLFHLSHLAQVEIDQLSGGERQRVSIARTIASAISPIALHPVQLVLLDEPFTGMDAALRDRIAPELKRWMARRKIPVLSVTHDIAEPFLLEAEVIRIANGRVIAQGPPAQVLAEERHRLLHVLNP